MKFLGVSGVFDYAGLNKDSRYRPCSCCLPRILTASASGLYIFAAQCPTPPILCLRFAGSLAVAAQDSRSSGSLLLSCKASSSPTTCRLSGKAMARTGLRMMPTFPLPPLKFRTAGFPRYGFKAGLSDAAFPGSWFAIALRALCCHRDSLLCVRDDAPVSTSVRAGCPALPQGPSLRSGLFCPGPSSLNRPHPPHSRAHPDFTVSRLIRDAFAVHICICL